MKQTIELDWLEGDYRHTEVEIFRYKKTSPKFSIVVANYNRGDNIGVLIESVLDQKFDGDLELIIIDDKSTDDSISKILEYDSVNLIQLDKNSGSEALPQNVGVYFAQGKYIGFIDSDDYLLSDKALSAMFREMDENPDAIMGISNVIFQIETKDVSGMKWIEDNPIYYPKDKKIVLGHVEGIIELRKRKARTYSIYDLLTHGYHIGFRVMKPEVIKEVGGWPVKLGPSDDAGILMRYAEIEHKDPKRKILPVDIDAYAFRITGGNVSFTKDGDSELYKNLRREVVTRINSTGLSYDDLKENCAEEFWSRWELTEEDILKK